MADVHTSKTAVIHLRLTPEEKTEIQSKADSMNLSISEYIRQRALHQQVLPGKAYKVVDQPESFKKMAGAESRTSPQDDLQKRIKLKMGQGKTSKLAEIEAREELGL